MVTMDPWERYARDLERCEEFGGEPEFPLVDGEPRFDDDSPAGSTDPHYTKQDVWVAQQVIMGTAHEHLDVGSRFDGFVTHLLAGGVNVVYVDGRPLSFTWDLPRPTLRVVQDDARTLATIPDGGFESISCLHALEHFGLGRYGDEVDPNGWRTAIQALGRVTAPDGLLYLSVPVGRQHRFRNWHRVFSPVTIILEAEHRGLLMEDFAGVNDSGNFIEKAMVRDFALACYACGIFVFRKKRTR